MLQMLIQNFCLGFLITAVPGAVFFEIIRRTMVDKASIRKFMVGNFSGMFVVIFSVLFGLSALLSNKALGSTFYALSGAVLVYIGITSILVKYDDKLPALSKAKDKSSSTAFLAGFVLAAANPISIVFWISMTGKMIQDRTGSILMLLDCVSIVLGASLVFALLIAFVSRAKNMIKARHLLALSRGFGLIISAYGAITISRALQIKF